MIFGRHDLILDPPISRVSLLACRNTLMYFNSEVQQRILERFHFGLRDSGYLFLGKAEMLLTPASAVRARGSQASGVYEAVEPQQSEWGRDGCTERQRCQEPEP